MKVGDKVRIRQWADMAEEYGVSPAGWINSPTDFVLEMLELCGRVFTVEDIDGDDIYLLEDEWTHKKSHFEMHPIGCEFGSQPLPT